MLCIGLCLIQNNMREIELVYNYVIQNNMREILKGLKFLKFNGVVYQNAGLILFFIIVWEKMKPMQDLVMFK